MKDPVVLPASKYVVDRVNIKRHLLNDERDPFTRQPLREVDLVTDKALVEEIEKWKKQRLEELKKGDKGIKYGKIGANKMESEEGVFSNNPVIEE